MKIPDFITRLFTGKEGGKSGRFMKLTAFIPVILVVIQALTELFSGRIIFRPFNVPPALEKRGYTGEVLTKRVTNRIDFMRRMVEKDDRDKCIKISTDVESAGEDITLPGTGVSLKHLTDLLRFFMGVDLQSITGDVVLAGDDLYVSASVAGKWCGTSKVSMKTPEAFVNGTAEHVMKTLEPFVLARFYSIKKKPGAMMRLAKHVKNNQTSKADLATAYLIKGLALFDMKLYEDALYQWGLAAAMDGKNMKALLYQGWALDELGRHEDAVKMYKKALVLEPLNPTAYNGWAIALYNMNNSREAVEKFKILSRIAPDYAKAYNNLGYLLFESGEYKEGVRHIRKAIELDAEQPYFYLSLAEGAVAAGRVRKSH